MLHTTIIGHPVNPAHLLPVVEICGGEDSPRELVERLENFYRDCGRVTATLTKPIDGFVTNREIFNRAARIRSDNA